MSRIFRNVFGCAIVMVIALTATVLGQSTTNQQTNYIKVIGGDLTLDWADYNADALVPSPPWDIILYGDSLPSVDFSLKELLVIDARGTGAGWRVQAKALDLVAGITSLQDREVDSEDGFGSIILKGILFKTNVNYYKITPLGDNVYTVSASTDGINYSDIYTRLQANADDTAWNIIADGLAFVTVGGMLDGGEYIIDVSNLNPDPTKTLNLSDDVRGGDGTKAGDAVLTIFVDQIATGDTSSTPPSDNHTSPSGVVYSDEANTTFVSLLSTANPGEGMGSYTFTPRFEVKMPASAYAETYGTTIYFQVVAGPI